jgi:phosphate starvation-inducible PhoH-like protein
LTKKQKEFLNIALDKNTKLVFVSGPAGSSKTYLAVLGALQLLQKGQIDNIIYIRSIVESASRSMGSLPGELQEKFHPWSLPLLEKLDEIIGKPAASDLMKNDFIQCLPVNFVRGLTFRNSLVIVDESQNLTKAELTAILTRFGEHTKYVIIGDSLQSDINGRSGYNPVLAAFNHETCEQNGIHVFQFSENEIVRSEILKLIVKRLATINTPKTDSAD